MVVVAAHEFHIMIYLGRVNRIPRSFEKYRELMENWRDGEVTEENLKNMSEYNKDLRRYYELLNGTRRIERELARRAIQGS